MRVAAGGVGSSGGGSGAPDDAEYLVRTADSGLSAERVVNDTASVIWDWGTAGQAKATVPVLVGDSGAGGTAGLVPAPGAGDATKFLRGDGAYATPSGGAGLTHPQVMARAYWGW